MAQLAFISLVFLATLLLIVRFGFSPARSAVPAGFLRISAVAVLACVALVWAAMAFVPSEGVVPISQWSSNEAIRWMGLSASAGALALFVPVLVAYGWCGQFL